MTVEELKDMAGKELAPSRWLTIDQERVNRFAEATGDFQWLHVDAPRARRASPYGQTVAHGFLVLSLLPMLVMEMVPVEAALVLNYGLNRVRFPAPMLVGSRLRLHLKIVEAKDVSLGVQVTFEGSFEGEGQEKPICAAQLLFRYYQEAVVR